MAYPLNYVIPGVSDSYIMIGGKLIRRNADGTYPAADAEIEKRMLLLGGQPFYDLPIRDATGKLTGFWNTDGTVATLGGATGLIGRSADVTTGRNITAADFAATGVGCLVLNAGSAQAFTIPTIASLSPAPSSLSNNILLVQCLGAAHTMAAPTLNSGVLTVASNTVTMVVGNKYAFVQRGSSDVWDCD